MTRRLRVGCVGLPRHAARSLDDDTVFAARADVVCDFAGLNTLGSIIGLGASRNAADIWLLSRGRPWQASLLRTFGYRVFEAPVELAFTESTLEQLARAAGRPGAGKDGGPPVSIVVTLLNEVHHVDRLVARLSDQMRADDELVLVDGGSTDGTWDRVTSIAARDPRVRAVSRPGSNISEGRNAGVRLARASVICCTDAGCEPEPDWLDSLRVAFDVPEPPGLVAGIPDVGSSSPLQAAQAAACYPDRRAETHPTGWTRMSARLFGRGFNPVLPFARSMAFSKAAWDAAGGFPEDVRWTEDGVFGERVSQSSACVLTLDARTTWAQRSSLGATYRMYRRYGFGAGTSGSTALVCRDAVRAVGYVAATAAVLSRRTVVRGAACLGAAAYGSVPLWRTVRRTRDPRAVALIPVALLVKDVGKLHGELDAIRRGRRARRRAGFTTPVRLAVVVPSLGTGGLERHAVTLFPALPRERFSVRLFCVKGGGSLVADAEASGVPVTVLGGDAGMLRLLWRATSLWRHLRAYRPTAVVTAGYSADVVGRIAGFAAGAQAIIGWKHNCGHLGPHGSRERRSEQLLRFITSRYYGVANAQLSYLTDYLKLPPHKIAILRNALPDDTPLPSPSQRTAIRRELGLPIEGMLVAIVAALRAEKDHATLLRAFASTAAAVPDAHLVIIGDGPERSSLAALAHELELGDRVHVLGDRSDVPSLLTAMDAVVLCSYTVECCPYSVIEAMRAGLPVVSTDVGGLSELVEDGTTGYLVPKQDSGALARALTRVLSDRQLRSELGDAGRKRFLQTWLLSEAVARLESDLMLLTGSTSAIADVAS